MPNPSLVRRHKGLVRSTLDQLLQVDAIRYAVAGLRYVWLRTVRKRLSSLAAGGSVATTTVSHNLRGLGDLAVNRSLLLARPLSVLEHLGPDAELLVIGPRTEGEILALASLGFRRDRITAVDLISYSPWVQLGDMHDLPFPESSFDAVVLGWVLAYSEDRARAVKEVLRVLRPGGLIAVGVEWNARSQEEIANEVGYMPGSAERIFSCDEIIDLFAPDVERVVFRNDGDLHATDGIGALVVILETKSTAASPLPGRADTSA